MDSTDPDKYRTLRVGGELDELLENVEEFLKRRPASSSLKIDLQVIDFFDRPSEYPALENEVARRGWASLVRTRSVPDCFATFHSPHLKPEYEGMCLNPWLSVSIHSDGDVVPCCFAFEKDFVYGSLREQSLKEIWDTSPKVEELRALHRQGNVEIEPCKSCYMRSPTFLHRKMIDSEFQLIPLTQVNQ